MTLMALLTLSFLISCVHEEQMRKSVFEVGPDPHLSSDNMDVYVVKLLRHHRRSIPTDYGQPSGESKAGSALFRGSQV